VIFHDRLSGFHYWVFIIWPNSRYQTSANMTAMTIVATIDAHSDD